ncbi:MULTISPECIES: extracellular solute-binding protein [Paenibacillus]|uniref:extracellular solute-binding protein n=1 Tax=Paenibacillus TaxID=44249 RepID=UPI0022B8E564|nr:extracellular solute-binding protein [Paenibacillus caseinilyticus]MCZ8522534.1 extracellular solute-binding protein [Paenibacillus caseinilyticus]
MTTQRFKQISVICALTLAASVFAGCANKKDEGAAAGKGAADTGPVKITMMANLQTPEVPSDKIEKVLEEKTNSQLEISWIPDGSYDEKFQASFATGTLPQVVYLKNQASFILMRDAMKDGQFWEVGPYLKDYPNLKSLNQETLNNTAVAGKIYSLYQEKQPARTGIIYRKDWADKLGLAAPQTADDIYNMLKKFKESDVAGKGNTIPLADRSDLVYGAFKTVSMYFGTPNNWGVVDGKLTPEFDTKGYMDTMKFFQKLHKEGLINQDFLVTSKTDQQNLVYSGKSGMYIGTMGDVKTMYDKTIKNVPGAQFDVTNEIKGIDGKNVAWGLPGYGTVVVFPKSSVKDENELKRILGVMDKFYSPEVADLLRYGLKDEHYTLVDGKVVPKPDPKLIEKEVRPYLNIGFYETTNITPSQYALPAHEKANTLSIAAEKFMVQDPTAALDSPTYNSTGSRLQDIIKDATYQFILGKIDEAGFQTAVAKWKKDGGQKIIDEYNEQYKNGGK